MSRNLLILCACMSAAMGVGDEPADRLPRPDYHRQSSDPSWLVDVAHFHWHLGPSVVAGARMGMAALRAVEARGYFDVEVTCEGPLARPPQACFLDGVQVATGATLGKRTLHWVQAERIVVRVKNLENGKTAELRPTSRISKMARRPNCGPRRRLWICLPPSSPSRRSSQGRTPTPTGSIPSWRRSRERSRRRRLRTSSR
jgi:hypothetical protein